MKSSTFPKIVLLSLVTVLLSLSETKEILARGCESYYRVTGAIAGCSDISTEDARKLWIEKYSICLDMQLSEEIVAYKKKIIRYYANNSERSLRSVNPDDFFSTDSTELPSTIALRETIEREGDSLCSKYLELCTTQANLKKA